MATARVARMTDDKPGLLRNWRRPNRRSWIMRAFPSSR
jgi:hypothetical protein